MESSFWKARWEANQIGFHEASLNKLLHKLFTLFIPINNHAPRNIETLGESYIDSRVASLLKVYDSHPMCVQ